MRSWTKKSRNCKREENPGGQEAEFSDKQNVATVWLLLCDAHFSYLETLHLDSSSLSQGKTRELISKKWAIHTPGGVWWPPADSSKLREPKNQRTQEYKN